MRAVVFGRCGDPSVLEVAHRAAPAPPKAGHLLVRVRASSVNGTDVGLRRGDAKVATWGRLPFVPGFDLAGVVVAVGTGVTAFAPGDRVAALLGHNGGGQAEFAVVAQHRAALIPDQVGDESAAAVVLAGLTALQALLGRAALASRPEGSRVLVIGATGGIGAFGVQLARLANAHVTAFGSGAKLPAATAWGAHDVIDRGDGGVDALRGRWDVVFDTPGVLPPAQRASLLEPGGILVSTRPIAPASLRALAAESWRRHPDFAVVATRARSQDLARLLALLATGELDPALHRVLPLEDIGEAHALVESGEAAGKVVVTIA